MSLIFREKQSDGLNREQVHHLNVPQQPDNTQLKFATSLSYSRDKYFTLWFIDKQLKKLQCGRQLVLNM